jgi:hypothetical protein
MRTTRTIWCLRRPPPPRRRKKKRPRYDRAWLLSRTAAAAVARVLTRQTPHGQHTGHSGGSGSGATVAAVALTPVAKRSPSAANDVRRRPSAATERQQQLYHFCQMTLKTLRAVTVALRTCHGGQERATVRMKLRLSLWPIHM